MMEVEFARQDEQDWVRRCIGFKSGFSAMACGDLFSSVPACDGNEGIRFVDVAGFARGLGAAGPGFDFV